MGLLDLLLPQRCVVCGARGAAACGACVARFPRLRPPLCGRCGAPTAWPVERCRECAGRRLPFASARAAVAYDDAVRALVAVWKDGGLRTLAVTAVDVVADAVPRPAVSALVPVPPDGDRSLRRGHHAASRLAEELARQWDVPAVPLLRRTGPSRRQRGLSLAERRRNVAGAFAATASPPSRVALVDDVYTTGATAAAAASALRAAGARRVEVVTFARAIRSR